MKKLMLIVLSVVMIATVSVTAFAETNAKHQHESASKEVCIQGSGKCRHGACKCQYYVRAKGGAGKCVCGHWDYVH